jgi:hypothetical protein
LLTIASTSPLAGSSTTTAPRRSPRAFSAATCRCVQAQDDVLPGIGSWLSTRITRPWALVSTSS